MAVADPGAEAGGGAHVLPAGCLEARLLLLVPLLDLPLAHPAGGQKDDVIAVCYGSFRWREGDERRDRGGRGEKENIMIVLSPEAPGSCSPQFHNLFR